MIVQERFPLLSTRPFSANGPQILLDGSFAHPHIQLEKLTPNALRSPESVIRCHLLDQSDRLGREPWFLRAPIGFVLPEHTEEFTMPTKKRLWGAERLFPSPNHPGQEHQKKPVRLPVNRVFYLSPENDQLVSQQRVFCKEFGFSSGQIGECAKHKGGRRWFNPTQKTFLKRMKAEKYALLDRDEHRQHELNPSFVKIGALEDEYKQNGPCLLYSPLTSFGKEACSIVRNMPIFRTDVLS
jgi:hypothetical protein